MHALVEYCYAKSKEESTVALREFLDAELTASKSSQSEFKKKKNKEIKELQDANLKANAYLERVETNINEFKSKHQSQKDTKIAKLFKLDKHAAKTLLQNDNAENAPDDVLTFNDDNIQHTEARMVSFKQLYAFNNLCLNRSYLRKRTTTNE